jgi:hypothetical protein
MELLTEGPDKILAVLPSAGSGGSNVKNSSSVFQLRKLMEDVSFDSVVVIVM